MTGGNGEEKVVEDMRENEVKERCKDMQERVILRKKKQLIRTCAKFFQHLIENDHFISPMKFTAVI